MPDIAPEYPPHNSVSFRSVCEHRARLYASGNANLQDAVDFCQRWADARGLPDLIGQDGVQDVMARAFTELRHDR